MMLGLSNRLLQVVLLLVVVIIAVLLALVLAAVVRTTGTTEQNVNELLQRTEAQAAANGDSLDCVVELALLLADPKRDRTVAVVPPDECNRPGVRP